MFHSKCSMTAAIAFLISPWVNSQSAPNTYTGTTLAKVSSAAPLECIWRWMTIDFHVMGSGKLIVIQHQIHGWCQYGQTFNYLYLFGEIKIKNQVRSNRCLHFLYMVHKSSWINVGKCRKTFWSPSARANQPPEKIHFQLRKYVAPAQACVWKTECSLSSAVYEW